MDYQDRFQELERSDKLPGNHLQNRRGEKVEILNQH